MTKEYYKVYEISKMYKITTRYVRAKIKELKKTEKFNNRIIKDNNGQWLIHELTLPNFKRQRKQKQPYYALTLDFKTNYSTKDIEQIIKFVCNNSSMDNLEFYYTIEIGSLRGKNHIHAYTNNRSKTELIKNLRLGFSDVGYKETPIFNLEGWKNYITKNGNKK